MYLEPQWPSILEGQPPSKQGLISKQNKGHLGSKPPRSRADGRIAWRDCCGTSSLSSWGSSDHGRFLFLMQTTWKVEEHPKCYSKYVVFFHFGFGVKAVKRQERENLAFPNSDHPLTQVLVQPGMRQPIALELRWLLGFMAFRWGRVDVLGNSSQIHRWRSIAICEEISKW